MSKIEVPDEFEFGDLLKDKITGFRGMFTGFSTYSTGCAQLFLTPKVKDDGKYPEGTWIDLDRLEAVKKDTSGIVPNPRSGGLSSRDPAPKRG